MASSRKKLNNEEGVTLVLVAVMLGALGFLAIALIADVLIVKQSRIRADEFAVQICGIAAKALPISPVAAEKITVAVNKDTSLPAFTELQEVRIIIPTPGPDMSPTIPIPGMTGPAQPLTPLLPNSSVDDCDECTFGGDVADLGVAANYPVTFLSRDRFGAYLACEVRFAVSTFVMDDEIVTGKAAFRMVDTWSNPGTLTSVGVMIGIAPQLNVSVNDPRFLFQTPSGFDAHNPLANFVGSPPGTDTGNYGFWFNRAAYTDSDIGNNIFAESTALVDNDRKNMLLGSYNPYIAFRNALLSSIVERLARLYYFRDQTQIALIPPYNFNGVYGLSFRNAQANANPPLIIADVGDDLTKRDFKLPNMNYKSGTKAPSDDANRYLCPLDACSNFVGSSELDEDEREHHMVVVSALRDAYHQNYESVITNGTVTIGAPDVEHLDRANFEPAEMSSRAQVANDYTPAPELPWAQSDTVDTGPTAISATEIIRVLGRFEECPYEMDFGTPATCDKEDDPAVLYPTFPNAPYGLKGDILSYLEYAAGMTEDELKAYAYPGNITGGATIPTPLYDPNTHRSSLDAALQNSHIFIVTSKRLQIPQERNAIAALIADPNLNLKDRPITVLFLPTNHHDMGASVLASFETAFHADDVNYNNKVYRFGPLLGPSGCLPVEDPDCFRNYWQGTLLATGLPFVSDMGRIIFHERFVRLWLAL